MTAEKTADDKPKTEHLAGSHGGATKIQPGDDAGEDEGGVPKEGDDSNVKEDQKPVTK